MKAIYGFIAIVALLSAGCDSSEAPLSPELFEGTWINPAPDLEDNSQICRIDIVKYAGGFRVKRWNPGDHVQQVWTEIPDSDRLTVQWEYSISVETLELHLLDGGRIEAFRVHDFAEERFPDREWLEYFQRQ